MRAIRSSVYFKPDASPLTSVLRDCDVTDTLESIRERLLGSDSNDGVFTVHEIFEVAGNADMPGSTDMPSVAFQAIERIHPDEQHMALMYYWTVMSWGQLHPHGILMMDKPTPLTRERIEYVFDMLARRTDYKNYTIISHTHEGERVTLVEGKIEEEED